MGMTVSDTGLGMRALSRLPALSMLFVLAIHTPVRGDTTPAWLVPVSVDACDAARDLSGHPGEAALRAAVDRFDAGCFEVAAEEARGLGAANDLTPSVRARSYALAARSTLARVIVRPLASNAPALMKQGETDASRAIALDDTVVEGHLQRAVALGMQARMTGVLEAHMEGLAEAARQHIDAALRLEPANPYARAVDAAWHIEIVAEAGSFAGKFFYGADMDHGMAQFEAARATPDAAVLFDVQFAVSILSFSAKRHGATAREALETARAKTPTTALDRFYHALATDLLTCLDAGPKSAGLRTLLARVQGRGDLVAPAAR